MVSLSNGKSHGPYSFHQLLGRAAAERPKSTIFSVQIHPQIVRKSMHLNHWITCEERGSLKRKNPAKPEVKKLAAKFVTVACRDDRALRLLTQQPHIMTLNNITRPYLGICKVKIRKMCQQKVEHAQRLEQKLQKIEGN